MTSEFQQDMQNIGSREGSGKQQFEERESMKMDLETPSENERAEIKAKKIEEPYDG